MDKFFDTYNSRFTPREYEMEALAAGALRVLRGEEEAATFQSIMEAAKIVTG